MDNIQSLNYFWPELIIVITALAAIIIDFFYNNKQSYRVGYWVLSGLVLAIIAMPICGTDVVTTLFMGMLAYDPFALFFKVLILISTILIILISIRNREFENYRLGEYFVLIAVMVFGMFLMVASIDLIMVYLSIETVSSLKYIIYGAFSSGLMLYGLSILFGLTGTTKIFEIREALAALNGEANFAIIISSILILAGFGYKLSIVPFHFWTPDVYEGSPTTITAYLSVAPKAAGFALIIRFFHAIFTNGGALTSANWLSHSDFGSCYDDTGQFSCNSTG